MLTVSDTYITQYEENDFKPVECSWRRHERPELVGQTVLLLLLFDTLLRHALSISLTSTVLQLGFRTAKNLELTVSTLQFVPLPRTTITKSNSGQCSVYAGCH